MKKLLARLPHPIFLLLLISHIAFFVSQLLFAHAKVRSAATLLLTIVALVGLSALAHFIPQVEPLQWPQLSTSPQQVRLTQPQLTRAIDVWQNVYQQQPRSETVALTLLSLCRASSNISCVEQTTKTIEDLNPALLSSTP